ncbi:MAG: cytochrome C [Gammaproteobacteria bacterium]|nr:cytochrome C [Gammaproteobacteria bacterium]
MRTEGLSSRHARLPGIALVLLALGGCGDAQPVKGFVLPEGDIAAGEQVFISYECYTCHTIPEVATPTAVETPLVELKLGGKVHRVKTYGDLLTSITNPEHIVSPTYLRQLAPGQGEDAKTLMPDYNAEMTVRELLDLVTFLHSHYEKILPEYQGHYLTL